MLDVAGDAAPDSTRRPRGVKFRFMAMPVQAPKRLFTVDEFYQMAEAGILREDDRVELLAGEVVQMTPIGSRHAACVSRLNRLLNQGLGEECIVRVQDPVRLDEHSEPQPDVAVLRFRQDFYREAHPGPADVLLVIEVADSSADLDREVKVPLYARAGVPEVWVVDLAARAVDVYREASPEGYRHHRRMGPADRLIPDRFPSLEIAVSEVVS
jgi:Uma2 family endonuclease